MGKSIKRKFKLMVPEGQGAGVLRSLADGLESGVLEVDGGEVPLEGFTSLGLSLKPEAEGVAVKLKIKFPAPEEPEEGCDDDDGDDDDDDGDDGDDDGDDEEAGNAPREKPPPEPKYSSLKKWMEKEFKTIMAALEAGNLPDADLVRSFVEDSRLMVRHLGKGDEYYQAYDVAIDLFEQAAASGSLERVASATADLDVFKDACHDKYK